MKIRPPFLIAVLFIAVSARTGRADQFSTYNVSAESGLSTFAGTLTVDNTLNTFTNSTVTYTSTSSGQSVILPTIYNDPGLTSYQVSLTPAPLPDLAFGSPTAGFDFATPNLSTLEGQTTTFDGDLDYYGLNTGYTLTGELTPVPEPDSAAWVCGAALVSFLGWHRRTRTT